MLGSCCTSFEVGSAVVEWAGGLHRQGLQLRGPPPNGAVSYSTQQQCHRCTVVTIKCLVLPVQTTMDLWGQDCWCQTAYAGF